MPTQSDIRKRISAFVNESVNQGVIVHVSFIVTSMMSEVSDIEGDDADFYLACGADFISKAAKDVIKAYEPKDDKQGQLPLMNGFKYLQSAYPVERDGERVLVPTPQISNAEFEARENELLRMAEGCLAHRVEMRDYRESRQAAA